MSASRSRNLSELRRLVAPTKARVVVRAIEAGLAVLESGLKRRCPVGRTHRLYRSIHRTRVGVGKSSAGGAVIVGTRYAAAVEGRTHFIRATAQQDGPKAERAMMGALKP